MTDFGVWLACIDAGPETRLASAFAEAFSQRVYRVTYVMPQGGRRDPDIAVVDEENYHISVWRTVVMDATIDRFRRRQITLPPLDLLPSDYAQQLGNSVRVTEERGGWRPVASYVKLGGQDDYLHSEVFTFCATELLKRFAYQDALALSAPKLDPEEFVPALSDYTIEPEYRAGFED